MIDAGNDHLHGDAGDRVLARSQQPPRDVAAVEVGGVGGVGSERGGRGGSLGRDALHVVLKPAPAAATEQPKLSKYIGWIFFNGKGYELRLRWPKKNFVATFEIAQYALDRCDEIIGAEAELTETPLGFRVMHPEWIKRNT